MQTFRKTGRMLGMAVLAASTALSGTLPSFAQNAQSAIRIAQAEDGDGEGGEQPRRRPQQQEGEARERPSRAERGNSDDAPQPRRERQERSEAPAERPQRERPARAESEEEAPQRRQAREQPAEAEKPRRPARAEAPEAERPARQREEAEPAERPKRARPAEAAEEAPARPRRNQEARPREADAPSEDSARPARGENAERPRGERPAEAEGRDARDAGENGRPNENAERPRRERPDAADETPARGNAANEPERPRRERPSEAVPDAGRPNAERRDNDDDNQRRDAERPANEDTPRRDARPDEREPTLDGGPNAERDNAARPGRNAESGDAPERANRDRRDRNGDDRDNAGREPGRNDEDNDARAEDRPRERPRREEPKAVPANVQNEAVPEGRIDESDARVQRLDREVRVRPVTEERGERFDFDDRDDRDDNDRRNNRGRDGDRGRGGDEPRPVRRVAEPELPRGAQVVERVGDRDILSIVGAGIAGAAVGAAAGYFIRPNDEQRLSYDSQDRYAERLSDGRVRETVVRRGGAQVVTITNRYGDVIQRSRIEPDGREVVLFYDPNERDNDEPNYYRDVGADLPPLDLAIPRDEYIVDVAQPDEELYYRTMVAPPVETVERIYSVDEVRRSERIRDKVRRIDLATINFAFGSDEIDQAQAGNLEGLAQALSRIIKENPDETFLVEGHTDAVGSDVANLALSDRRASSVASALSEYFDVPPENLVTQGYGEQYLKVNDQGENRENRRVTVRRITPLVKPVETSQVRP